MNSGTISGGGGERLRWGGGTGTGVVFSGAAGTLENDRGRAISNGVVMDYTDAAGDTFLVNYAANSDGGSLPNDMTLTVLTVAPEPSTWAMMGVGAGLPGLTQQRRRALRA